MLELFGVVPAAPQRRPHHMEAAKIKVQSCDAATAYELCVYKALCLVQHFLLTVCLRFTVY